MLCLNVFRCSAQQMANILWNSFNQLALVTETVFVSYEVLLYE